MERRLKKAIVLGATGLVGRELTQKLLGDLRYCEVLVFSRSPFGENHPRLTEIRADLLELENLKEEFAADVVFCCVGTTKAKTPDKNKYRAIDFGIPVAAAKLCKSKGIPAFQAVSALGADPQSRLFYNRIKGEMEVEVIGCGVPHTHLLQPSLIGGNRDETRRGERIAQLLMKFFQPVLVGPLAKYRIVEPEDIAKAMIYLADHPQDKARITSDQIRQLAQEAGGHSVEKAGCL